MQVSGGCLVVTAFCLILLQPTLYYIQEFWRGETTSDDIIRLSVSGKVFTTTKTTFIREKASLLGRIASGSSDTLLQDNGAYFIDRDPELFSYVLEYLRTGKITRRLHLELRDSLCIEAEYYGLKGLKKIVQLPFQENRKRTLEWIKINEEVLYETFSRLSMETSSIYMTCKGQDRYEVEYTQHKLFQQNSLRRHRGSKKTVSIQILGTDKLLFNHQTITILVLEMKKRFSITFTIEQWEPLRIYITFLSLDFWYKS